MARVTVEDCLKKIDNRFFLVHAASMRARQLEHGARRLFTSKNKNIVQALREIASGKVTLAADTVSRDPSLYE